MRRLANHDRRLAVLREQRVERVQQGKMLRLHRQRLFRNRHCLRRHREGEMTDNRADSVLVPVINGEIRAATGFERARFVKLTRVLRSCLLVEVFVGVAASALLLSAGKPKLAATIPNKRCGQK